MRKHIKKKIEKIKQRPLEERKKFATYAAGGITILVVIVWLLLLSIFGGNGEKKKLFNTAKLEGIMTEVSDELSEIKTNSNDEVANCGTKDIEFGILEDYDEQNQTEEVVCDTSEKEESELMETEQNTVEKKEDKSNL